MKLKMILSIALSFSFLFASQLTVKSGDVTLLINGQEFTVPKDQNLTLTPGTMVCFVKGMGTVVIGDQVKLNSKNPECYQIPLNNDSNVTKFLSTVKDDAALVTDTQKKAPASSRGIDELKTQKGIIKLPPSKKELVIYSNDFGTLPVTLSIKKPDGTVIKEIVNDDNDKTLFRVPAKYLENNSMIKITNGLGDVPLEKKVSVAARKDSEEHSRIFYDKGKHTVVDILYGTDRKRNTKKTDWENYYTGERGKLQYGIAEVSIPKTHKFGEMERPHFWQEEKTGKHVLIVKLENIDDKKFVELLKSKLHFVKEKDILIFIHGFNVTFANAVRRTAQISYDLDFKGVPMAYSWPSKGEVNEYMRDESSVQYTVPHLVAFLKKVIKNRGDANIHIIGHSMGTRALTNALKEISYIYQGKHVFKNIILAAPDIDKDVFQESLLPYIAKTTDKITLYASSDDSALKLSNTLHSGERIGQGGNDVFVYEGLDTIDASGIDTSLLGHSYFAEKEVLITDLKEVINKSLPPTKRKSLIEKLKAKLAYWKFKIFNK